MKYYFFYLVVCIILNLTKIILSDVSSKIIFATNITDELNSEKILNYIFKQNKLSYNRVYESKEKQIKKWNLIKSLEYIKKHNQLFKDGYISHELSANHFIDLSSHELSKIKLPNIEQKFDSTHNNDYYFNGFESVMPQINNGLPNDFDWRLLGKVTNVKDQLTCNCCYAFTVISTIESAIAIRDNLTIDISNKRSLIDLSEQQIVDCTVPPKYHNNGCKYGYIEDSYQYVMDYGILSEQYYPYKSQMQSCQEYKPRNRTFIYNFKGVSGLSEKQVKQTILDRGPVITLMNNDGLDFLFYDKGIIRTESKTKGKSLNHAVVIVGWGIQNNTEYWIVKNSWSKKWGENGFARIAFGVRGINSYIYYPLLSRDNISDIYNNILIFVFISLAILMFISLIAILMVCCNKRGKITLCFKSKKINSV